MAGESQLTPKSEPDPSVLTTDQLMRGLHAERDFVAGQIAILIQRMDDKDEATKVLSETVNRTPTAIQLAVSHLQEVMMVEFTAASQARDQARELADEKFRSVQTQFAERDERALRASRDNKVAVDAAFAAQKEAAAEQNKSNTLAIDKSEKATNDSINKLGDASAAANKSLSDKIEDVKSLVNALQLQVNGVITGRAGGLESLSESRNSAANTRSIITFGIGALVFLITIIGIIVAFKTGGSTP